MSNEFGFHETSGNYYVYNSIIKIDLEKVNNFYRKTFFAKKNEDWIQILSASVEGLAGLKIQENPAALPKEFDTIEVRESAEDEIKILLSGTVNNQALKETITVFRNSNFIKFEESLRVQRKLKISRMMTSYNFIPEGKPYKNYKPLDFIFTPTLRPKKDQVIADHVFRSPVVILQKGGITASLIPDIDILDKNRKLKTAMDLNVEESDKPFFSYGFANWEVEGHVYYYHNDSMVTEVENSDVVFGYYIYLDAVTEEKYGYEKIMRFMWEKYGVKNQIGNCGALNKPIEEWGNDCWYKYAKDVWMDVNINGEEAGAMNNLRLSWSNNLHESANNDAWFNVWFQNLRTAYGMFIYGSQHSDNELMERAKKVLTLALNAPQKEGIFPAIYYQSNGHHWVGDQSWGGIGGNFYAAFHSSFQCYWLLKWYRILEDEKLKMRILDFCSNFAEFILKHQYENGVLPSWFDMETLLPSPILEKENAETAGASLFLTELYLLTENKKHLTGAKSAIDYLEKNIIPENKWFDYETFFSCSRKDIGFYDNYTKQHPQNTLSLFMAVETYKNLYLIGSEESDLKKGIRLLDYLLLYQQVWSPSFLSRPLLGGFGVQNTDAEWSDARQAYFSITLLDFYKITGRREYFERAVEAARSMYGCYEEGTVRCYENYGHSGADEVTGVTGISWGTGSSMTSLSIIQQNYGDLFIDIKEKWGKAVNFLWIENLKFSGNKISFDIEQPVKIKMEIKIVFNNPMPAVKYDVEINGKFVAELSTNGPAEIKYKIA